MHQNKEKEQKLKQWEIWVVRMTEKENKCQEKLRDLKSKGEPQDKKEVEDQIILAKVSLFLKRMCFILNLNMSVFPGLRLQMNKLKLRPRAH